MPATSRKISFQGKVGVAGKPRTIERNTFRYTTTEGATVIRLHFTDILTDDGNGKVQISSGGWRTRVTRDRLNRYLAACGLAIPHRIVSIKGIWHVAAGGESHAFIDGMTLPVDGKTARKASKEGARQTALKKRIRAFVDATMPDGKPLPLPSNGDCWYCSMFAAEKPVMQGAASADTAKLLVKAERSETGATSHLLNHIEEGYLPGSLAVNALRFAGIGDAGIAFYLHDTKHARARSAVRRYIGRKLGLATH